MTLLSLNLRWGFSLFVAITLLRHSLMNSNKLLLSNVPLRQHPSLSVNNKTWHKNAPCSTFHYIFRNKSVNVVSLCKQRSQVSFEGAPGFHLAIHFPTTYLNSILTSVTKVGYSMIKKKKRFLISQSIISSTKRKY